MIRKLKFKNATKLVKIKRQIKELIFQSIHSE